MSVSVEKLEKSMVRLTIEVSAEEFDKAINKVYNRQKNRMNVPGFRRGKTPRKVLEKMYGESIFYEDAANDVINSSYPDAARESGEDIVSNPDINVTQIEAGQPFIYTAEVAVKPPVTLGKYKGVEVKKQDVTVTEEDIDADIRREQEKAEELVARSYLRLRKKPSFSLLGGGFAANRAEYDEETYRRLARENSEMLARKKLYFGC